MNKLEIEEYWLLPNSKWLRDLIELDREDLLDIIEWERYDKVWQEDGG